MVREDDQVPSTDGEHIRRSDLLQQRDDRRGCEAIFWSTVKEDDHEKT